jgi:hypothetical protein
MTALAILKTRIPVKFLDLGYGSIAYRPTHRPDRQLMRDYRYCDCQSDHEGCVSQSLLAPKNSEILDDVLVFRVCRTLKVVREAGTGLFARLCRAVNAESHVPIHITNDPRFVRGEPTNSPKSLGAPCTAYIGTLDCIDSFVPHPAAGEGHEGFRWRDVSANPVVPTSIGNLRINVELSRLSL